MKNILIEICLWIVALLFSPLIILSILLFVVFYAINPDKMETLLYEEYEVYDGD